MRLNPEQRALADQLMAETLHECADPGGRFTTASHAQAFTDRLRELEGSGVLWVSAFLESLTVDGAKRACSDWKRRERTDAKTKKGTGVSVQSFAGVQRADDEGRREWVQMPLDAMPRGDVAKHHDAVAARRDTLSREVRFLRDLLDIMEADESIKTAGEALVVLMREAS